METIKTYDHNSYYCIVGIVRALDYLGDADVIV